MNVNLERKAPKRNSAAWRTAVRIKEQQALDLHLAGVTFDRIAEQLGYQGRGQAWRAVHRLLARNESEGVEHLKASKGAQLDRLMVAIMPAALRGEPKAVSEARRLNESYRRLFGLDSPIKVEQTVRGEVDQAIIELVEQMGGTVPPPVEVADDAEPSQS